MAGGTQNRDVKLAYEIHQKNRLNKKLCGCPIHKKNGEKTLVASNLFNRQRDSKDGLQGMCSQGKTLLDSFKHKLNGFKLVYIYDKITGSNLLQKNIGKTNFPKSKEMMSLFLSIADESFNELRPIFQNNVDLFFELTSNIDSIIGDISNSMIKRLKVYDSNLNEEEFKTLIYDFDPSRFLDQSVINNIFDLQDKFCDDLELMVVESKNGELHTHSNFRTTLTKIREVYLPDGTPFKTTSGTHIRINKFNTQINGKSDNRVERYFPDGDYKMANSKMREINKMDLSADHIWPISLGGKHDQSNLEPLPLIDNIKKRDNLTVNLINKVKNNPQDYISSRYLDIFLELCQNEITDETVITIQRKLKLEVENFTNYIKDLDETKKDEFIKNLLLERNSSHTKSKRIIEKYFT